MRTLSIVGLLFLVTVACSSLNREGPNVTCADLQGGAINACQQGIIASCRDGKKVTYQVCTNDVGDTTAEQLCSASWQTKGAYKCEHSGASDAGGTAPTDTGVTTPPDSGGPACSKARAGCGGGGPTCCSGLTCLGVSCCYMASVSGCAGDSDCCPTYHLSCLKGRCCVASGFECSKSTDCCSGSCSGGFCP